MTTVASGGKPRPPNPHAALPSGAPVRRTAQVRPRVPVRLSGSPVEGGFRIDSPYVRRFWVAAIGAGAVAELLRLVRAAQKGTPQPLPRYLPQLLRAQLVTVEEGCLVVPETIPPVPVELRRRFSPVVAASHSRWLTDHRGDR